ncbi:MAG: HNH endonuclease [Acidobacteria bacterium]|nr:HNH endonuclease [Acidobacteriota bacterium]
MAYSNETLNRIYDRTDGRCHICGKKLSFVNYANLGRRGAWQVEHSHSKANGGSNYLNNLFPACISCNLQKATYTSRTTRAWHGRTCAPLSKSAKKRERLSNTVVGVFIGGLIGAFAGSRGVAAGAAIGGLVGSRVEVDS